MSKKIDVHVHVGNDLLNSYTPDDALRLMDKNNIELAVISPVPSYPLPFGVKSSMEQNDTIARALRKFPDRFVRGLGVVDPRHGKSAVPEIDRMITDLGLHGLMFSNDRTGVTFDNPIMFEFMEQLSQYENPIVFAYTSQYSVLESPFMLMKVADNFPNITFINGSAMKDTTHGNFSRYISSKLNNVYLDLANLHQLMTPIKWAINEVGVDKILFGTNIPFCDFSPEIRMIDMAEITSKERNKIYFENAARIFNL